jgi:hypothetical protein
MTVNTFITQGKEQQQLTIGNGSTKDELQATGMWLSINADDAMEIKP